MSPAWGTEVPAREAISQTWTCGGAQLKLPADSIRAGADDQKHLAARREWERELNSDELLHTSSYVLVETAALPQRRTGLDGLVSFEAIRRLGIDQVLCFDAHFAEQGFPVLPAGG